MADDNTNIIYTAADIQKYLQGSMSPAEMHALEKAALDDPFLAEAIEGYEAMKQEEITASLTDLKKTFAEQNDTKLVAFKPTRSFKMWKAAAAILIVCIGVSITYLLNNKSQPQDAAIAVVPAQQESTIVAHDRATQGDTTTVLQQRDIVASERKEEIALLKEEPAPLQDSNFMYRPQPAPTKPPEAIAGGGYIPDSTDAQMDLATSNALPGTEQNNAARNEGLNKISAKAPENNYKISSENKYSAKHTFSAQVTAPDNTPIPFAKVIVARDNLATYTDTAGNFYVVSADSLINIEVKSIGYTTRNAMLRSTPGKTKIVLAEDNVMARAKAISDKSAALNKKRRPAILQDTLMDAAPADGWNNYNIYLNNSLLLSNKIPKNNKGDFEITFDVQENGVITNLKVENSLCEDCDEELLRIIKEGPKWKVKKGKKASARVSGAL
jgi:hypothetical protein